MSDRRGFPYQWWKSTDLWSCILLTLLICGLALLLLGAWFR